MRYVVSACLAGHVCRYDGRSACHPEVLALVRAGLALPVCPEVLGGLPVPRLPCEKRAGRVLTATGVDCSAAYLAGAQAALRLAREAGCTAAILKARSPSCGVGQIYDGCFRRRLTPGDGVFAALLRREGFALFTEESMPEQSDHAGDGPSQTLGKARAVACPPESDPARANMPAVCRVPEDRGKGSDADVGGRRKTGVLLVAFGAGDASGRAALRRVQQAAEERFGLPVRWAFTSDIIRERLARARTKSDSVLKALRRMRFEHYTHVAVQSLHVIPGHEYGDVATDVRQAREEEGLRVSLGLPLLVEEADTRNAARLLLRHLPPGRAPGEAVVCMAHGSHHESDWLYEAWGRAVHALDADVHVAGMKGAVTLEHVLPRLEAARPPHVWLLPLLSIVGRHTLYDMAGLTDAPPRAGAEPSWKARLEHAGFACTADVRGLADGPEFVSVWLERLGAALAELGCGHP